MASAFSRLKNATNSNSAADVASLLQSKAGLEPVTPALLAAGKKLQGLGLISYRQCEYVRCAFTEDTDFKYSNRTCVGRLTINDGLDENADNYRCPECGRIVYPHRAKKRRFQEVRAKVLEDGVRKYVQGQLAEFGDAVQVADGVPGAWRIGLGLAGVHVCLADFCDNQQVLSIQWAQQNPTCYVAVNPKAVERFIDVDWVQKVMLADVVAGRASLAETARGLAAGGTRRDLPPLATPAYSKGAHRPEVVSPPGAPTTGTFLVEFGTRTVKVNGIEVVAAQAHTAHAIMRQLAKAFVEDLMKETAPKDYLCQTPSELADVLQESAKKDDAVDQDLVRRSINRLQENMETRLRKAGHAVERDDVIQASPNIAKEGYRLNPFKVAIRPRLDGDS